MTQLPFLGEDRKAIVDMLLARMEEDPDRLNNSPHPPRILILRAESGAGKSRIIREFYERLRADERYGDGYWPPLPEFVGQRGGHDEPSPVRKWIGPDPRDPHFRQAGSLPKYLWWTLTCDAGSNALRAPVSYELAQQIEAHRAFATEARRKATPLSQRFTRTVVDNWRSLSGEYSPDAGLEIAQSASGFALPGAGMAIDAVIAGVRYWVGRHRLLERIGAGGALDDPLAAPSEIFQSLASLAHPDIPMVLAIEDMHLMGPDLAVLTTLLGQPGLPWRTLVVGTAWPEVDPETPFGMWLESAMPDRALDEQGAPRVQVTDLQPLDETALAQLIRHFAPNTADETVHRVAAKWTNPFALQLLLTDEGVQQDNIRKGALELTDDEITDLPGDVYSLYERRWKALPPDVRYSLMAAVATLPEDVVDSPSAWPFIFSIVAEVASARRPSTNLHEAESALSLAATHYDWIRTLDRSIDLGHFKEWALAQIAAESSQRDRSLKDPATISRTVDLLAAQVAVWLDDRKTSIMELRDEPRARIICRWLLAIADRDDNSEAIAVAAAVVALDLAKSFQYQTAIELCWRNDRWKRLRRFHPGTDSFLTSLGTWLYEVGRNSEAIEFFDGLLLDQLAELRPGDRDALRATFRTRFKLAVAIRKAGGWADAEARFRSLLVDRIAEIGEDADSLQTRHSLAISLRGQGRRQEALAEYEQVLAGRRALFGENQAETLWTRHNVATLKSELGRHQEALEEYGEILKQRIDVSGMTHPDTLWVLNSIGVAKRRSGASDEALDHLTKVLELRGEVLGEEHPDYFTTRLEIARCWIEQGFQEEATREVRTLRELLQERLDATHPLVGECDQVLRALQS